MSSEQAETYLRQLAESELRLALRDHGRPGRLWPAPKLVLAAQALTAAGVIDAAIAGQIRDDLAFAVAAREPHPPGPRLPPASMSGQFLAIPPSRAAAQTRPAPGAWRIIPVGQVIPGAAPGGDVTVLAYLGGPAGARFAITGGMPGFPGQLTATDDQGSRYHLRLMRGPRTGVLELLPAPARRLRWLDVFTGSGEITARIDLHAPDQGRPQPEVTVTRTATSPGELMLDVIAARILATIQLPLATPPQLADPPPVTFGPPTAVVADLRAFVDRIPGDVTTAMLAAGALSAVSPRPGQLAALCERLDVPGHGISAPPAAVLPEHWASILSYRGDVPPLAPGRWAMAVTGPVMGATQLSILGLDHTVGSGTMLHTLVSGAATDSDWEFTRSLRPARALWVRDSSGGWHTTLTSEIMPWKEAGLALQSLAVIPALAEGTAWIDVISAAPGIQAQVRLPLPRP